MRDYLKPAALRRALARVRENHGCPGADDVPLDAFDAASLDALRQSVDVETYSPWPLRRIEVEKHPGSTEKRMLLVPAVRDRTLQTAVAAHIEPFLEAEFDSCSFGYRRGRSVRMAVERVYQLHREGYVWILDADIDDFFSNVNRELIIGRLSTLIQDELIIRLVRLWLDYAVWDGLHLTRPDCGLPQGAVISPMLANLCLDTLDANRLLAAGSSGGPLCGRNFWSF